VSTQKQPLVGMTSEQIAALPVFGNQPGFRGRQVASWIYARGAESFASMTNLPKELRVALEEQCTVARLPVVEARLTVAGDAEKLLFGLADGLQIEAVILRTPERDTLCISTQAGCAHGCAFCATAAMGLLRNLTPHEIVSQVMVARGRLLARGGQGHFNLVFMGMGEPLANYEAVVQAIRVLHEDHGLAVGRRRMTVSTVGLAPEIRRLAQEPVAVRLALSLNATTNEVRSRLMPINRRFPIEEALSAVAEYGRTTSQRVTLEYVLLLDINDSTDDARRLAALAHGHGCKINLIAFNPHPLCELQPPSPERVRRFLDVLLPIAPEVTLRESKGADIQAACGQLSTAYRAKNQA
jgi:23S rRNA (adenine2503-C2)-methyltransferase